MALRPLSRKFAHTSGIDSSLELFEGLSPRNMDRIRRLLTVLTLPAGKVLARQGELGRDFVIVLDGQVAVIHDGTPLAVLTTGCHFGELPMLYRDTSPHLRATLHALGPVRVAVSNRREFASMLDMFPVIKQRIWDLAERRETYISHLDAHHFVEKDRAHPGYPVHTLDAAV